MKLFLVLILLLCGCGGSSGFGDFIKPTIDNKVALVLKRFQQTTCKETCLVDLVEECYKNLDTGEVECINVCPLDYLEFKCIDLYRKDGDGKNVVYNLSPLQWQKYVKHLFGYYNHEQRIAMIGQIEFLCEYDFITCENHFDPIEALKRFIYNMEE